MKKTMLVLFVCALLFGANKAVAQKSFEKGNILLNPGLGLGSVGLGENYSSNLAFFFSADFGVHDYISAGPYAGLKFFGDGVTGMAFGGRGNFHWWQLLDDKVAADLKQSQLDIYWTLFLGYNLINEKRYNDFGFGSTLGLRWYTNSNNRFAIFGEFGRTPIAYSTIGLTIKAR
jgi:hypothetical protein